jgi:hypothetical protein
VALLVFSVANSVRSDSEHVAQRTISALYRFGKCRPIFGFE